MISCHSSIISNRLIQVIQNFFIRAALELSSSAPPVPVLVDIDKLIILPIRQIQEGLLTESGFLRHILMLHTAVLHICGLAILHSTSLVQFVQEHQIHDLDSYDGDERDEDGEHAAQTRVVLWRVLLAEEEGTDNVAGTAAGVVERHDDGLLGGAAGVADDPGDDQRVAAEEEGEEVVCH